MTDPLINRTTDNAFLGRSLYGGATDPTFAGALSFMRRRYTRDLTGVDLVVWGIPFDSAVSNRPGARFGPQAIRRASAIFDGDPQYPFGFDIYRELAVVDWGDASYEYGRPDEAHAAFERQAAEILSAGVWLVSLGGDHSVTWPLLKAHAALHGPLALVQFDAHQDTWPDEGTIMTHGAFVGRAVREGVIDPDRSIQLGIRTIAPETCGIEVLFAHEIDTIGLDGVVERVLERVGEARTYVTFDIDVLDASAAPGTGTPVAGGWSSREALTILRRIGRELDLVGGDVVEVAPAYDHADMTAIAGATAAQHLVGLFAEKERRSS